MTAASDLVKTRRTRRRPDDEQPDLRQRRVSLQRPDPSNCSPDFVRSRIGAVQGAVDARGGVNRSRAMALACRKADRAYLPAIGISQRRNSLPGKLGSSANSGLEWPQNRASHLVQEYYFAQARCLADRSRADCICGDSRPDRWQPATKPGIELVCSGHSMRFFRVFSPENPTSPPRGRSAGLR